jgi:hypothetical protein
MPTGHPLELVAEFEERPSVNPTTHGTKGNTSMAKFLFVYRSDKDTFDTMAPEELRRFHQKWGVFTDSCKLVRFPVDKFELGYPPTTTA